MPLSEETVRALYPLNLNSEKRIKKFFDKIGVDPAGTKVMTPKFQFKTFVIKNLDNRGAAILKQDILSIGGEAAISGRVLWFDMGENDVYIAGTVKHLKLLAQKMKKQPYRLKELGEELEKQLNAESDYSVFGEKFGAKSYPLVMGILNLTPDSFYDGGKYANLDLAVKRVEEMIEEGADIIDLGGESTRPGSKRVDAEEELKRVLPVLREIKKRFDISVSIDTYKSEVAKACLEEGADMINDISFGTMDKNMFKVVAEGKCFYVGMHIKGTPENMQKNPEYKDCVFEIREFLRKRSDIAVENGILREKIIVDPGIGFGKKDEHNLEILRNIPAFSSLGFPVLIGVSRKSMFGRLLGLKEKDRLAPSLAVAVYTTLQNVFILRVHDVFETKNAVKITRILSE